MTGNQRLVMRATFLEDEWIKRLVKRATAVGDDGESEVGNEGNIFGG
jgi:hypothetical protein